MIEDEAQMELGVLGSAGAMQALSRLLWHARERVEMAADSVEHSTGREDMHGRRLVADIDAFRAAQGWSPNGFGGEGPR